MAVSIPPDALPVDVNAFKSPASVWAVEVARNGMSEERRRFHEMEIKLSKLLRDNSTKTSQNWEVDELVAVRDTNDYRKWRRGRIESVLHLLAGTKYKVLLIDYGTSKRAKSEDIRNLPSTYDLLPPQAMLLVLGGIVPVNLEISSNYDALNPEVSSIWSHAATKYVEEMKQGYEKAYFVEYENYPRNGCTRFGDILLYLKSENGPISISEALCKRGLAKLNQDEFQKRQKMDTRNCNDREMYHPPLPPSTDTSKRKFSTVTTFSTSSVTSNRPFISEYLEQMRERTHETKTVASPETSLKSSSGTDNEQSAAKSKLSQLLSVIRSQTLPATGNSPNLGLPMSSPTPGLPSFNLSSCSNEMPSPATKALDSRFIPAGRSVQNDTKAMHKEALQRPKALCGGKTSKIIRGSSATSSDSESVATYSTKNCQSPFMTHQRMDVSSESESNTRSEACASTYHSTLSTDEQLQYSKGSRSFDSLDSSDGNISSEAPTRKSNLLKSLHSKLVSQNNQAQNDRKTDNSRGSSSNESNANFINTSEMRYQKKNLRQMCSLTDDDLKAEDFLARSVLLHGGFPPTPWLSHNELKSKFTSHVEKYLMERLWFYNILTLEKFMWPAIQMRQNVVMVSPRKSGKTSSYVIPMMDFMIDLEQTPRGNGPLVLILCAGSKDVQHIHRECVKVVNGMKNAPRIEFAYGLTINKEFLVRMLNGCEVFITTPPCLLRIYKDFKNSFALNFKRLFHLVLDQADILLTRFREQIQEILSMLKKEQNRRNNSEIENIPIQVVVSSERWEPLLLSFSKYIGNPLLCINDCFEACVYGKPEVIIHKTPTNTKPSKLLKVLRDIAGLHKVVVFCDSKEVPILEKFIKNDCMSVLVPQSGSSISQLEGILHCWDTSRAGDHHILLCTDEEFDSIQRRDATVVVHYSLPSKDKIFFMKRLSSILDNLCNLVDEKPQTTKAAIYLLIDDTNTDQFPTLVQLMQRISNKIDERLIQAEETIRKEREKTSKFQKLLCKNLKMYGECRKLNNCQNRHVYISDKDESNDLPQSGFVTLEVIHVHSATHFSARIIEHELEDHSKIAWTSSYLKLGFKMSSHFSKPESKVLISEVNVGDIYAMQTFEDMYHRVQVLEVVDRNKYGDPSSVLVKFLDEGKEQTVKVFMLNALPEELKRFPAQVVDIFLCGLLPGDQDDDFGFDAISCVQKWFKKDDLEEGNKERLLQGKIMLTMNGSLWIDPGNIMKWLSHMETYVLRFNIKQNLIDQKFALENPEHLLKLYKLCGRNEVDLIVEAPECVKTRKSFPKPEWAFLESDKFEDVEFICADDVSQLYVRKTKFQTLLDSLMSDICKEIVKHNRDDVLLLEETDFCLAHYEAEDPKWYRARIISKDADKVTVFYVDYGDQKDLSLKELKCIPDWAITRLPFQAIECSLAGIASCDVDKLYDVADIGPKNLKAKVCDRKDTALQTGGRHYIVAMINVSGSYPSILNKDLLQTEGVEPCEDQMEYLNIELDSLLSSGENISDPEHIEIEEDTLDPNYLDLNLADLEFQADDLSDSVDEAERFEVCGIDDIMECFQEVNPNFKENISDLIKAAKCNVESEMLTKKSTVSPALSKVEGNGELTSDMKCGKEDITGRKPIKNDDVNASDWEEEEELFGRCSLPMLCCARPPPTKWLEDLYYVWIKICLSGVENYFLQCTIDTIKFSTTINGRLYHLNHKLRGIILPDSIESSVKGFSIDVKMKKACSGIFWGRAFSARRRFTWLTRDLEAAGLESSDSDCDFSLGTINKEIRKLPLKLRKKHQMKKLKEKAFHPDLASSDTGGSNSEGDRIDSDEMF